jgi:hypothetical protein
LAPKVHRSLAKVEVFFWFYIMYSALWLRLILIRCEIHYYSTIYVYHSCMFNLTNSSYVIPGNIFSCLLNICWANSFRWIFEIYIHRSHNDARLLRMIIFLLVLLLSDLRWLTYGSKIQSVHFVQCPNNHSCIISFVRFYFALHSTIFSLLSWPI